MGREVGGKVKKAEIRRVEAQLAPAGRVPEDDAIERDSRNGRQGKGSPEELRREWIRGTIEILAEQGLEEAVVRRVQRELANNSPGIDTVIASEL